MNILLIGSGAREHALAKALGSQDQLAVMPGNPGINEHANRVFDVDVYDFPEVVRAAREWEADLVVIGSEGPLVYGLADALLEAGINCFGPTAAAAKLEGSKAFAKGVMQAAGVETARALECSTLEQVEDAMDAFGAPYVIKYDGLAAGKGVVVTEDRDEARNHAEECLNLPDGTLLVEEHLSGPEVSVFCICDGELATAMMPVQDYKRLLDDGEGPNTGGMGAYAPLSWAPADLSHTVVQSIAQPVVDEMARRGTPFTGVLYCGLILTEDGPKVIEFNVRFGDPEIQAVLECLDSPLAPLLHAAATGNLSAAEDMKWGYRAAVNVVVAAGGYPAEPRVDDPVTGIEEALENVPGLAVYHANTRLDDEGTLLSAGGRILSVVGTGMDVSEARENAYEALNYIRVPGCQYRWDIAAHG